MHCASPTKKQWKTHVVRIKTRELPAFFFVHLSLAFQSHCLPTSAQATHAACDARKCVLIDKAHACHAAVFPGARASLFMCAVDPPLYRPCTPCARLWFYC